MRLAKAARVKAADESGDDAGIVISHVPGNFFPSKKNKEKFSSENKHMTIDKSLFADDTTVLGGQEELDRGVRITKEYMAKLEERNNDDKEE